MSVPHLRHIVEAVRASTVWAFDTKEDLCAYSHACILACYQTDPNFGKLKKLPAQNHCVDPSGALGAVDVLFYWPTGQVVDFIVSAGYGFPPDVPYEQQNAVSWHEGLLGEYPPELWFAPTAGEPTEPPTDPDLEARVAQLERDVKALTAKDAAHDGEIGNLKAVDDVQGTRIGNLETGRAGPVHTGTGVGQVWGFVPVKVDVTTTPKVQP